MDFNSSARLLIGLCDSCNTLVGLHGGFGLRPRSRVTLRPEVGILFDPGEDAVFWTFGLGLSIRDR